MITDEVDTLMLRNKLTLAERATRNKLLNDRGATRIDETHWAQVTTTVQPVGLER